MFSFVIATLTGFLEPIGGAFGVHSLGFTATPFPVILGFASGAMLFIISDEIIPETHSTGNFNHFFVNLRIYLDDVFRRYRSLIQPPPRSKSFS